MRAMADSPTKSARILLVKTSSLGDVIHNLPVATDIRRALPSATIDWVCEPPYAPLVALHPAVTRVFPMPLRAIKKKWYSPSVWMDFRARRAELGRESYDLILDTQGLVKSAWIAGFASGIRAGYDAESAREPLAARNYQYCHAVSRTMHAVARNRALAAAALRYTHGFDVDYGLAGRRFERPVAPAGDYVVFLHATSRQDKTWPTERWIELGKRLQSRGFTIVLPWGASAERTESERIARALAGATHIPPALTLPAMADLLAFARLVVGVDTGLAHLAVALDRPTIGLYCATDPGLTGLYGGEHAMNLGGISDPPEVEEVMVALQTTGALS